ncbi:hypothetical protein EJB05_42277, partial [Eragrostis curvula]
MAPPPRLPAVLLILLALLEAGGGGTEILSKSRLEGCVRDSDTGGNLSCNKKLIVQLAVPSGAVSGSTIPSLPPSRPHRVLAFSLTAGGYLWLQSGGEVSLVAQVTEVTEVEGHATAGPTKLRHPVVITVNKSPAYTAYALTYLRDVAYKPEEQFVETRRCEPDAGANVVKQCERFHVFAIGTRSLGFTIRVQLKKGSSVSIAPQDVIVGPDNMTVVSGDNFLRVTVIGDFAAYKSMPHYEGTYLVIPRKGEGSGPPEAVGDDYSRWMLLAQSHFTEDGNECNKIGVGYQAFQNQPDFCSVPVGSCLFGQLWTYMEEDKKRINANQTPRYIVGGRFERINQHPVMFPSIFSPFLFSFANFG